MVLSPFGYRTVPQPDPITTCFLTQLLFTAVMFDIATVAVLVVLGILSCYIALVAQALILAVAYMVLAIYFHAPLSHRKILRRMALAATTSWYMFALGQYLLCWDPFIICIPLSYRPFSTALLQLYTLSESTFHLIVTRAFHLHQIPHRWFRFLACALSSLFTITLYFLGMIYSPTFRYMFLMAGVFIQNFCVFLVIGGAVGLVIYVIID